jgi:hypothetical protein
VVALAAMQAMGVDVAGAATWHVAPGGGGRACTAAVPCGAFDVAFDRARAGDTVEIGGGTYAGTQELSGDKASAEPIVVRVAPGAEANVEGRVDVKADHVHLEGPLRARDGVDVDNRDASDPIVGVRITGVQAPSAYIQNARDIVIRNSRFGGVPGRKIVQIGAWPTSYGVVFDNVHFGGNPPTDPSQHLECIFVTGVQGLTVRNSTFRDCGYFGLIMGLCCGAELQPRDVVLERNTFGPSRCYPGSGGCRANGEAPFSLMLGNVQIGGRSRIVGNRFDTPPALDEATFADLTASGNSGSVPRAWARPTAVPLMSARVSVSARLVRVRGTLSPQRPGALLVVTLFRHGNGHFRRVVRARAVLTTSGRYATALARPRPGLCRVTVRLVAGGAKATSAIFRC